MNKNGPFVIIEDDEDDLEVFREIFRELNYPNEVLYFTNGVEAYKYLHDSQVQPFIILSDVNLPKLDGFALREKIHNDEQLRLKCIPYLFFTTAADQRTVIDAYSRSVQGFFTKPNSYPEILRVIKNIIEYWRDCHSPNIIQ
jgi:CheY-like chemotaxis protein